MKNSPTKLVVALLFLTAFGLLTRTASEPQRKARSEITAPATHAIPHKQWDSAKLRVRLPKTPKQARSRAKPSSTRELGRIKDELVIRLPKGMNLDDLARLTGISAEEVGRIEGMNAYRLRFPDEAAAAQAKATLEVNPQLAITEDNHRLAKPVVNQMSDGTAVVEPNNLRLGDANGQLIVGLVDSPVQATGSGLENFLLPSISVAGEASVNSAELEHGTAMASAILQGMNMVMEDGSTTTVRILPVDVYGNAETTTIYQLAEGVVAAVEAGATVINLSLGSETDSPLLQDIIRQATDQGVVFLAAAGNTPTSEPTYPAAYEEVIAVTSTDYAGAISQYANYGEFVDVGTPGSVLVNYEGTRQVVTGTSVSTALATGITVGLAEIRKSSADKVEATIREGLAVR